MPRRRSFTRLARSSRNRSSGGGCLILLLGILLLWFLVSFGAQLLLLGLLGLLLYFGYRLYVWRPKALLWIGAAFLGLIFLGLLLPKNPALTSEVSPVRPTEALKAQTVKEPADQRYNLNISATYPGFTVKAFAVNNNRVDYQRVIAAATAKYSNEATLELRPGDYKLKLGMEGYTTVFWFRAFIPKNRNIAVDTRKFKSEFLTRKCKQNPRTDGSPFNATCPVPVQVAPRPLPRPTTTERLSAPLPLAQPEVYYPNCAAARAAGAAPLYAGEPGYRRKLDRDGDGVACE